MTAPQTKGERYEKSLEWRHRNQNKIREYNATYYQQNKDAILARRRYARAKTR